MPWTGLAAVVAVLGSATFLGARDLPEIKARGSLRVLVVLDAPRPEFFSTDAAKPGFDRELLDGFARTQRLKLEVTTLAAYDDLIPALLARTGDLIAGGYRDSETRRKQIAFSDPVFPNRFVIVTLKPHPVIRTLDELRKERVGTTRGTATAEAVVAAGVPRENIDDGIPLGAYVEALRAGRITAAVWSVERALPAQREDPAIQLGLYVGRPGSLAFGVRKEDAGLKTALNAYLQSAHTSGVWSRLVVKYFGEAALPIVQQAAPQQ
jgi:ABC-type amino acid transport substrate-binding protein